ncbi:MAG: helix-turn-helix transcriptional regulator [Weeksellaceae bacterium]
MLRIKEILKEKGVTQIELAEKIGITQVGLNRMINGNPTAETLLKIAQALDIDIRELFVPTKEDDKKTIFIETENGMKPIGEIKKGSV